MKSLEDFKGSLNEYLAYLHSVLDVTIPDTDDDNCDLAPAQRPVADYLARVLFNNGFCEDESIDLKSVIAFTFCTEYPSYVKELEQALVKFCDPDTPASDVYRELSELANKYN